MWIFSDFELLPAWGSSIWICEKINQTQIFRRFPDPFCVTGHWGRPCHSLFIGLTGRKYYLHLFVIVDNIAFVSIEGFIVHLVWKNIKVDYYLAPSWVDQLTSLQVDYFLSVTIVVADLPLTGDWTAILPHSSPVLTRTVCQAGGDINVSSPVMPC